MHDLGINYDWFAKPRCFFDNARIALGPVGAVPRVEPNATIPDMMVNTGGLPQAHYTDYSTIY